MTWQTPVNGSWLSKVAGLLYDLVGLAPNTKLLSSKVVKALRVLLERKQLELRPRQGSTQDILDRIDLTLRILLTMVRTLKTSPSTKTKVYRSLSIQEQQEVDMILEKVCLPAEFVSQGFDPEEGDQHVKVPVDPEGLQLALPAPPLPTPCVPKRKFAELKPVPSIFQDIIDGKRGSGHRSVVPSSGSAPVISEEDVLQGALAFKPPQANGKKPSKPGCGKKKKGKAAKKKPSQPKNPGPAKPAQSKKQKQKNKKEKDAQKAQGCGLEVPPGVSSFKFQSSKYGQ